MNKTTIDTILGKDLLDPSHQPGADSPRNALYSHAMKMLSDLAVPSSAQEDWKYTNLKSFLPAELKQPSGITEGIEPRPQVSSASERLVFINGACARAYSSLSDASLVRIIGSEDTLPDCFMKGRLEGKPSGNEAPRRSSQDNAPFPLLNDLLSDDIVCVEVPEGKKVSLEITHISSPSQEGEIRSPRLFVHLEKNATAEIVEHFTGHGTGTSVTSHVAEFVLEEHANATHTRIQSEDSGTLHLSSVYSEQVEHTCFKNVNLQFGGSVSRNEIYPSLPGSHSEAWLIGTNVLDDTQHVDNFTVIDHIAPHCESHELYKGIYADSSKGVFSGTIIVQREAQKTNAYQSNASLLLSNDAESSSKPQLKIWADDVKCSHGATIGQLDEQSLFYLRARGIPEKEARAMLTRAYIAEVFEHIEDEKLRDFVEEILNQKLDSVLA